MKKLLSTFAMVAALAAPMATVTTQAQAGYAYRVSCTGGYSPAHRGYVYTGVYSYAGSYYTMTFRSYCPGKCKLLVWQGSILISISVPMATWCM